MDSCFAEERNEDIEFSYNSLHYNEIKNAWHMGKNTNRNTNKIVICYVYNITSRSMNTNWIDSVKSILDNTGFSYIWNTHAFQITNKLLEIVKGRLRDQFLQQLNFELEKSSEGSAVTIKKLSDLKMGEKCCVIGTLFKKMELKPNILKEISQQHNLLPLPPREKYVDDTDLLVVEDEAQRVPLTGNIPVQSSVTGTIVALSGYEEKDGKFFVDDYCYCGLSYQAQPDLDLPLIKGEDRYVILISGLGIGAVDRNQLSLQLFIDLITGHLGSMQDQEEFSKVVRVIIAGNSLSKSTQSKENEKVAKYLTRNIQAGSVDAIKELDDVLVQLGSCVPVDVMPGEYDPANHFMPQQPLHKCMFGKALSYPTVQSVSNPYEASIGGVRILGTAGQNINDIYQFSCYENRMDILEHTLMCGHICPTCPDTLSCYPYYTDDPLLLRDCPNVYFAGNQPSFASKILKGDSGQSVLLVSVPEFSSSSTAVIVNLKDMSCMPLSLGASLSETGSD